MLEYTAVTIVNIANTPQLAGLRETFQLLDDPECNKLGRQTWVLITIVMTELFICIKFGKETMTKPLPRHIALWWVLGAALLIIYTFVKFYLLKPEHVPKPEKENIIMGSSGDTPEEEDEVEVEPGRGVERPENFTHQTQPNRETKKEA